MANVLFVCGGNVFRSLTAEYALRYLLGASSEILVSSAGTKSRPDLKVRGDVAGYLLKKGLDVAPHQCRRITPELVKQADIVIAMHTDHKQIMADYFKVNVPHFMEACGKSSDTLPDIDDLFAPTDFHSADAVRHIEMTIDKIMDAMPVFVKRFATV